MEHLASAKHKNLATKPYRKIKVKNRIKHTLHLPGGQQIIIHSLDGSFRVWDLERGTQVGEEWEDKERGVFAIALSPDGKTIATGSEDGAVRLWNIDTGKVIKNWTGHTVGVQSVCWSPDGRQVVSGSWDGTFRMWDAKSGETILGPIKATGKCVYAVCYSPDGKMIATAGGRLKIWDANTAELLETLEGVFTCLAWTSDGKTLFAGGMDITKFETAMWTVLNVRKIDVNTISLSPNERILASTTYFDKTAQLWNLETNQPIGKPLYYENYMNSATFSADGKFLVIGCFKSYIHIWDVSTIVKKAGLLSDIVDATTMQQPSGATQSTSSSSQQPPFTTAASTPSAVVGTAGTTGTISRPHITGAGWRTRFVGWLCCLPIQNTNGHH